MTNSVLTSLAKIYPPDRLLTQPAALAPYECDALTATRVRPQAVVLPETQDDVVETVRLCHELGVPFVARGSGTSLSGGSQPLAEGIVIALNRLNRVVRLDPQARIAVVEPGIINLEVSKAAAPYNLYYAPDPASQAVCTIGGNVAFNAGGVHCLKYGMTSNHVLGIVAVLADGEVVRLGGESLEGAGPDLPGLFVGNEGLFGIALQLTLRLIPKVESYRTLLAAYRSLQEAGDAVSMIVASGLLPGALEIMDPLAIKATEAAAHPGYPLDAGALLIVELEGEAVQVEADFADLLAVIGRSGAYQVRPAKNDAERALIWKGRKSAFSAVGRLTPQYIVQDGVVPRSNLGVALAQIGRWSQEYGIPVANVFHAGDGNLHPLIFYDAKTPDALHKAEEMASHILHMCIELGGSITGEHGVGLEKRAYLPQMFSAADMATMTQLRRAMDPKQIANRGKMLEIGAVEGQRDRGAVGQRDRRAEGQESRAAPGVARFAKQVLQPRSVADVQEAVRSCERIALRGGGSKPGLSTAVDGATVLDMRGLSGIVEYEPDEFVFTALAGTSLAEVTAMLAEHGQYLPFDPPLVQAGATLGGAVASGLSGPGRYRYGGLRDFVIGVRFVDGRGDVVRGGGKVVKNSAGFDLPKLMVGSLGRLGALVELSFKVFPQPPAFGTVSVPYLEPHSAQQDMQMLARQSLDIEAIDLAAPGEPGVDSLRLLVRIGGREQALAQRADRLRALLRPDGQGVRVITGSEEAGLWRAAREFAWAPAGLPLIKVPTAAPQVADLADSLFHQLPPHLVSDLRLRFSVAGNVAWVAWPSDDGQLTELEEMLKSLRLAGVVVRGPAGRPLIGARTGEPFYRRVKQTLDPEGHFLEWE